MKKNYLRWTAMLFAGLSLTISSCTDSDADGAEPTNPIFPEAVEAAIMPGDTYTLRFETILDWEASIPASVAQAFYIQDGTQQTIRTQGKAGKAEVEIGCYDIASFDDDLSCEVTLTMAKQSKVIATLTINKQERALTLRTSKVEDGSFVYGSDDLRYEYNEEPAKSIDLIWPAGNSGYMYPIMVEANFSWRLAEKSEWIADADYVGEAGQQVEILLRADPTKYPLDGDNEGKFVLCARNNAETKYEYKVTIPACRDHFSVSGFAAESRFNAKGLFYSAGSSSAGAWVEGGMHGEIVSVEEPVIYKFAEVSESEGFSYLEAEESQTAWIEIETALEDADNVLKTRRYTVTVKENTSDDARKGVILALPASVAATLEGAWELAEMDIKEEYQQYIVTRVNQYPKPDLVSAVNPEGMTEVGAALERLDPEGYSWAIEKFGVTDLFNLLYTKAWSNEDSTLAFEREYTSYKCYNYDSEEMTGDASWLTVEKNNNGTVINMDPSKDTCGGSSQMNEGVAHAGFIVFADAEGDFVLIRCVYDENASVGGDDGEVKVAFQYPEWVPMMDGSTLELLTEGELFEEYNPENGAPVYHLTFYKPYASMSSLTGLNGLNGISQDEEWLSFEPSDGATTISMNADALKGDAKTMTSSIVFYNSSWAPAVVLVCTLDLTNYTEEDE